MREANVRLTLDEWLRLAYSPERGCPLPATWLEAERQEIAVGERATLEAHAVTCPACAAERALARAFEAPAAARGARQADVDFIVSRLAARRREDTGAGRVLSFPTLKRRQVNRIWLPLAAALALAVGISLQLAEEPDLPAPPSETTVRGGVVLTISPAGEQAVPPGELRWEEVAGAHSYRVSVSDIHDTELWSAEVASARAGLPDELLRRLEPAVVYSWQVEGLGEDGARIGSSERVSFWVRPAGDASPPDAEGTAEP